MTLRSIFAERYAEAAARETAERPGESYVALRNGATIRVRVQGRRRQVILGRARVPVSEAEIATFCRDGQIPADAERRDYADRRGWQFVALRWEAPATLWEMPSADLPI
jgi:hypothetical protein